MKKNIDDSLNLLKQLEVRLKTQTKQRNLQQPFKTEYTEPINKKGHWGERLAVAYETVEQQLQMENRQLKKQVNKLIKMNDYLKNQLQKSNLFELKQSPDKQQLKMEIQYLRELNKQKDLELKLLKQGGKTHNKSKSNAQFLIKEKDYTRLYSAKCLAASKNVSKVNIRKKSEISTVKNKSHARSKCPLCY